jgi:hypothetical protein
MLCVPSRVLPPFLNVSMLWKAKVKLNVTKRYNIEGTVLTGLKVSAEIDKQMRSLSGIEMVTRECQ